MTNTKKRTVSTKKEGQSSGPKIIGRPRTRVAPLKLIQTRCPEGVLLYIKSISVFLAPSKIVMVDRIMTAFLKEKPWENGFAWRQPKMHRVGPQGAKKPTGWVQLNVELSLDKHKDVVTQARLCDVSAGAFCYTAVCWWIQDVYPPSRFELKNVVAVQLA